MSASAPISELLRELRQRRGTERRSEFRRLQGCIDDLISVLSLPAMWTGQDSVQLVGTLLDAVIRMLRVDFAYASLNVAETRPRVELVRATHPGHVKGCERHIREAFSRWSGEGLGSWPSRLRHPLGEGEVSILPVRVGIRDDIGVIVAASARAEFPCDTDRLLLGVAASQAAIWLQEARLLSDQKRLAAELDAKVAERTRELAAANEELRRITDAIPQAIVVQAPDGTTLYVNEFVLEYTGLSVDDAMTDEARSRIYHPDDTERVRDERQRGLSRGDPFELEVRVRRKDGLYRWFLVQYRPLRSKGGEILRWYATATDIEQRRRTEERVRNENLALRDDIDRFSMFEEIVGSSEGLRRVLRQVAKVAPTDSTVLIVGETGTGKELVARAIHRCSHRAGRAFIRVNCAAIPPSLVASELFGHEKGAFTGAVQRHVGRFEAADGGTIFLDEIGDLPADTQIALLRVLQERQFERVGSSRPVTIDVRVLAATHRDLGAALKAGSFREDLFYRLNGFPIEIPPLRARRDDIPLLVQYFIDRYASKAGKCLDSIDAHALELFREYAWPGNVRELQNVVERAVILSDGDTFVVDESWLRRETHVPGPDFTLASTLAHHERELIVSALVASKGRVSGPSGAAARLGLPRQTLESKIRALHIDRHHFRAF